MSKAVYPVLLFDRNFSIFLYEENNKTLNADLPINRMIFETRNIDVVCVVCFHSYGKGYFHI